jgi:cysteinyl-tRNA synthetase
LDLAKAIDTNETLPAEVAALIEQREASRAARDWATADALREAIRQHGYETEDTPAGTRWRKIAHGGTNG